MVPQVVALLGVGKMRRSAKVKVKHVEGVVGRDRREQDLLTGEEKTGLLCGVYLYFDS